MLTFARPLLLIGLLAAILPLLIHLLLRPRRQRVRFPAIVLLWPALEAGRRAARVRHYLLLASRMCLLLLAALLLAGPTCAPRDRIGAGAGARSGAHALAIVLDDSASMYYRTPSGFTRIELARREAVRRLDDLAADTPATAVVLLAGEAPDVPAELQPPAAARGGMGAVGAEPTHARPLGAAVRRAAALLRTPQAARRTLVLLSDVTTAAFSDVSGGDVADLAELSIAVVAPFDVAEQSNLAVDEIILPTVRPAADATPTIGVMLRSAATDADCWLSGETEQAALPRFGPLRLEANTTRLASIVLPAQPAGPHALAVRLEPDDRLTFDQARFAAFEVARRPPVWLAISDPADAERELTALLLRNLLAPALLAPSAQVVELRTIAASDFAALPADEQPALIVALGGGRPGAGARQRVLSAVEAGATLLLVPSSAPNGDDWPDFRSFVSATPPQRQESAASTTLTWDRASPYAVEPGAPGDLGGVAVRRWLALGALNERAVVHARYADGSAAIASVARGAGRVIALTTSPDPEWSDLGADAAGLLTWLHRLVGEASGPPQSTASFLVGQTSRQRFATLPASGSVRVVGPRGPAARNSAVRLADGLPETDWPTATAGVYAIYVAGSPSPAGLYAVNWPTAESDLTPLTERDLRARFGDVPVTFQTGAAPAIANERSAAPRLPLNLQTVVGAALLLVLCTETLLARRGQPLSPASEKERPASAG